MIYPLVSVVMPVYNTEPFLKYSIESILNQSYTNFEFIIINDGSTDKSEEIIKTYKDKRIIYIKNDNNIKLIKTLNKGLKIARGKYIARMDSDDIALKDRLKLQVEFMEKHTNFVVCGSWAKSFGFENKIIKTPVSNTDIINEMIVKSPIIHPTALIKKEVLDKYNINYDEKFKHVEDYKLWYDLSKHGLLYNLPIILLEYRISNNQVSYKYNNIQHLNTAIVRRLMLDDYLSSMNYKMYSVINIDLLKFLFIQLKKSTNNYKERNIIYCIFFSLNKYSFKSLFIFLFSFIYFYKPFTFINFIKLLYKHINKNRWLPLIK